MRIVIFNTHRGVTPRNKGQSVEWSPGKIYAYFSPASKGLFVYKILRRL